MQDSHLTLRLPDDLNRELERAAVARGVPKSMVVREAVARYLASGPMREIVRPMSAAEFARVWTAAPHLTREEADAYAEDIAAARAELPPLRDSWE